MGPRISISPDNNRKSVAFKLVLFPLAGLSKSSRALRGNEHGSMTEMPHLQNMEWDFAERLSHITRGTTKAYYNYDGSGERVRKVVEKGGITEMRLYLGGFEIFRKKVGDNLELEHETLHIMDFGRPITAKRNEEGPNAKDEMSDEANSRRRIAVIETKTWENNVSVINPTPLLRYQFDNHLGSATLELDESANIISYEEYYPYGDTCYQAGRSISEVRQKRYRYTGKEKDDENGLYYLSARYYSSMIGIFISVDPKLEKYPGVSSYAYCLNNPIKYIDPDGREVRIRLSDADGNDMGQEVQYKDGKLYEMNGEEYTGGNEYALQVLNDLNQLSKDHNTLKRRLNDLVRSRHIHTIRFADRNTSTSIPREDGRNHRPRGSVTTYNPNRNTNDDTSDSPRAIRTPRVGLAHELLGHGWDSDKGKTDYTNISIRASIDLGNIQWRPQIGTILRYEINAVNIENLARAAAGDVKRTTYDGLEIPENLLHDTHRNIEVSENQRDAFYELMQLPEKIIRALEAIYKYRPFPYFY